MSKSGEWYLKTQNQHDAENDRLMDAEYNEYIYWAEYAEYIQTINEGKPN